MRLRHAGGIRRDRVCGIDAAYRPWRTGIAVLESHSSEECKFSLEKYGVARDLYHGLAENPDCIIIGLDAPVSLPYKGYRSVERTLHKHVKARLLPGGLHGMRLLSITGCMARWAAYEAGILLVETHPSTTARVNGLSLDFIDADRHVVDAILAGLAGAGLYCASGLHVIGQDGYIVIPYVEIVSRESGRIVFRMSKRLDVIDARVGNHGV